ncbi:MAG: substrate-binding domain-containing protein [Pyrinomonadaceae bacterium]|nr:substrate-binding domain-containing protein [Pyrinomonadaceae bacterium]
MAVPSSFIPLALVRAKREGHAVEVDERRHQPINQAIAVVKASRKQEAARRFVEFVMSSEGQTLLERYGYRKP